MANILFFREELYYKTTSRTPRWSQEIKSLETSRTRLQVGVRPQEFQARIGSLGAKLQTAGFPWGGTPLRLKASSCKNVHAHTSGDLEGKGATGNVEHQLTGQSPSPLVRGCNAAIASNLLGEEHRVPLSGSDLSLGETPTLGHSYGVVRTEGNTLERTRPDHSGIPLLSDSTARHNSWGDNGIPIAGRSSPGVARPAFRGVTPPARHTVAPTGRDNLCSYHHYSIQPYNREQHQTPPLTNRRVWNVNGTTMAYVSSSLDNTGQDKKSTRISVPDLHEDYRDREHDLVQRC